MEHFECTVRLDEESGVYRPGQVVTGNVTLTLNERALIKSFAYKFSAYARTHWHGPTSTKEGKKQKSCGNDVANVRPTKTYENREDYLAITNYMIGSEEALPQIINVGHYIFQLSVRLPDACPPSLECSFGHIRYLIDCYIENSRHKKLIYTRNINITQTIDLRQNPKLLEPINIDCNEQGRRSKFWQRPLQLHVNIPQTGYVPGERISVYVKLLNESRIALQDLIYNLNMRATYRGFSPKKPRKLKTKVITSCLLTSTYSLFGQNVNILEHLTSLQVPSIAPSLDQTQCRCFQRTYEVEVNVGTCNSTRNISARMPIVVGTISLHDHQQPIDTTGIMNFEASAPPLPTPGHEMRKEATTTVEGANLNISLSSLTSSFREADFMTSKNFKKDFKHQMRGSQEHIEENFKPKYLYYNFKES